MPRSTRDQSVSAGLDHRSFGAGDDPAARMAAVRALEVGDLVYIPDSSSPCRRGSPKARRRSSLSTQLPSRLPAKSRLAVHCIGSAGSILAWLVSLLVCLIAALTACAPQATLRTEAAAWSDARQLVLVITPDWNDSHGTLRMFARGSRSWQPAGATFPVVIGRAGAAWGLGLHPTQPGNAKHEGDGRSPAGVFAIGTAFGYAQTASTGMPYAALNADEYCIDVSGSPLYNRIVDASEVGAAAVAGSSEPMRRDLHVDGDQAYKIGFVIEHNPRGAAGAGSCIFAHLWKSADSSTAGCTAMAEALMRELLSWLRADAHPVFVLLPQAEYLRLRAAWQLPVISAP